MDKSKEKEPEAEMLENLEMLLDLDVVEAETDWGLIGELSEQGRGDE